MVVNGTISSMPWNYREGVSELANDRENFQGENWVESIKPSFTENLNLTEMEGHLISWWFSTPTCVYKVYIN